MTDKVRDYKILLSAIYNVLTILTHKAMTISNDTIDQIRKRGGILSEEVTQFAIYCYEGGVISKTKAEMAFQINSLITEEKNTSAWSNLFVKIISDYLLQDLSSPGEVDCSECNWLLREIQNHQAPNSNQKKLVRYLKIHTTPFPVELEALL